MNKNYEYEYEYEYEYHPILDEKAVLDTHTNWNSPQADKERTIFGNKKVGLFYNYSDRLYGGKAERAYEYAALVAKPKTAEFFKSVLSYFHDGANIDLQHIQAGCNRSSGFPYLIFGYNYEENPAEDAARLESYDDILIWKNTKKQTD